jgi:hypothetical protein
MRKIFLILLVLAIAMVLTKPQYDFGKQTLKYGVPSLGGLELGSVDVTTHNYFWYNDAFFVRVYDLRVNLPLISLSKTVSHKQLQEFIQSQSPEVKQALSTFNPPALLPFEQ